MKLTQFFALTLLAVALPSIAQMPAQEPATDMASARERLVSYLANTTSLSADFRALRLDEDRAVESEQTGRMAIKRPGRFRWDYQTPEASLIVSDGEMLWTYDPDLEQAMQRRVDELEGSNPTQLLGGDADLDRDFEVMKAFRVGKVDWIEVKPKDVASDFDLVRLGFVEGTINMMEMHDKLGYITQFALTNVVANGPLDDALFAFEPPAGTDIVDGL